MRRLLIAVLALAPALAWAAAPAKLETRSQLHSLTVDVVPIGDGVEYIARVTDLASGQVLAETKFGPADQRGDLVSEARDLKIRIHLQATYNGVFASAEITRGDTIIDSMDARWALKPTRQVHMLAPGALRVGGDVKAPVVVEKVEPVYSEEARKARVSGIVIVEVLIDKSGAVRDVAVLKPLPFGLDQSAVDAVRQWKFKPATQNGQPVDVVFNLTVNFKLDVGKPAERNR